VTANHGVYSEWQWRKQFFHFRKQYDSDAELICFLVPAVTISDSDDDSDLNE
jgi:hypothetical protein